MMTHISLFLLHPFDFFFLFVYTCRDEASAWKHASPRWPVCRPFPLYDFHRHHDALKKKYREQGRKENYRYK